MTIFPTSEFGARRLVPHRRAFPRRVARRRGLSLLELLLVLAVLVAIAALALPAFHGPLENHRLRKAGDRIRVEWTRARIHAMKSGRIQAFFYTPQGNRYWIEPLAQATDMTETSLDDPLGLEAARRTSAADPLQESSGLAQNPLGPHMATLPDNVQFMAGGALLDERDLAAVAQSGPPGVGGAAGGLISRDSAAPTGDPLTAAGGVAQPILFYPDGTSATARIVLGNTRQHFVVVELRGLTGLARASDLLTAAELPP